MTVSKGCWTCKDRKISCDRATPACHRCTKAKRSCDGYGIRLSWPDHQDQKRMFIKPVSSWTKQVVTQHRSGQWVNVCPTDIRLHLVSSTANGRIVWGRMTRAQLTISNLPNVMIPPPTPTTASEMELLYYFKTVVSPLLPMISTDRSKICRLLMRIALSSHTESSRAVKMAIFTLASLHRGDDPRYSDRTRLNATSALLHSMRPDMDVESGVEHIAAGLVLCVVEMQHVLDRDSTWIGHVCGAKEVIQAVQHETHSEDSDASIVLRWVHYCDVLSRFSFRHWRTDMIKLTAEELGFSPESPVCALQFILARNSFVSSISSIEAHAHPLTHLLGEVFHTHLYSTNSEYRTVGYQGHLDDLSSRLKTLQMDSKDNECAEDESKLVELLRLAGLVYLERVARNFSGQSLQLSTWTTSAQSIIATLNTFPCSFALFTFGCEAHRDEDRMVFLDLFTRLEKLPHLTSMLEIKGLMESVWIQNDLEVDVKLEYIHTLNLVLSSRSTIPSFM